LQDALTLVFVLIKSTSLIYQENIDEASKNKTMTNCQPVDPTDSKPLEVQEKFAKWMSEQVKLFVVGDYLKTQLFSKLIKT